MFFLLILFLKFATVSQSLHAGRPVIWPKWNKRFLKSICLKSSSEKELGRGTSAVVTKGTVTHGLMYGRTKTEEPTKCDSAFLKEKGVEDKTDLAVKSYFGHSADSVEPECQQAKKNTGSNWHQLVLAGMLCKQSRETSLTVGILRALSERGHRQHGTIRQKNQASGSFG